jgi:hypothetical protein
MTMKKQLTRILTITLISAIAWSCNQSDPTPKGTYVQGVFVTNIGNFFQNNGSLSYFSREKNVADADVYSLVNGSTLKGGIQGYTTAGDFGVILVDNSSPGADKVEIVNANTLVNEGSIYGPDIENPRKAVAVGNNKVYVTNWNTLNSNYSYPVGYVAVVDLETKKVIKKINTDKGPENLVFYNDKVFVGDYVSSEGKNLTVISTSSDEVTRTISFSTAPNPIGVDANGKLWVQAGLDLIRLNPDTYEKETTLKISKDPSKSADYFALSPDLRTIYFMLTSNFGSNGEAYKFSITDTQVDVTTPFVKRVFTALAVDPLQGLIYGAVTPSPLQSGYAIRYRADGTLVDSIKVGIAPNGFYFR